jgi:DMSO/TMAO reductase YedYZ molybdopterin-dependent catalytic subunit
MSPPEKPSLAMDRRAVIGRAGVAALMVTASPSLAASMVNLGFSGDSGERNITTAFPQKGPMILQRTRPPLLETPFEVFDRGAFTPNDQVYVRWHWAGIPTQVDANSFSLRVHGAVNRELQLSLKDVYSLPQFDIIAVNQCSGNSRGFFQSRVPGAQWANGAMGNARWTGVRLKDVLDRAGVKTGAVQVRMGGLDQPVVPAAPDFMKSLAIDHARDGVVMIAHAMNGKPLPLLNGFPLRLVVPGWFATYWIKMLNDIEVLDGPDENFWMKSAYLIPDTPNADMKPGQTGMTMVPIGKMAPRSFVTNLAPGATVRVGGPIRVRGIAFGGDTGVAKVEFSDDGGKSWRLARLASEQGKYGFRLWDIELPAAARGERILMVRCTNNDGVAQPDQPNWNPSGFMRNVVETTPVTLS